jgi:hypothetical protein
MSEPVTLEDIYQLFRASAEEFERRLRESDLRRAEMERKWVGGIKYKMNVAIVLKVKGNKENLLYPK